MSDHSNPALIAQSERLTEIITAEVRNAKGWIGFDRYMEMALYTAELGYYSSASEKFGLEGDFVTAPLIGSGFARCMARQALEILSNLSSATIVEFGAGTGQFAADFMQYAVDQGNIPDNYLIIETSPTLQARQKTLIWEVLGDTAEKVSWVPGLGDMEIEGVYICNELLDAMPVKRFQIEASGLPKELGVGLSDNGFEWQISAKPLAHEVSSRILKYGLKSGYRSEVGMVAEAWIRTVQENLRQGVMLICDYGYPGHEYYHQDRSDGTLMCHYQHQAHPDPFYKPGLQDITAHIDFSAIRQAATEAGMETLGYCSQGGFLLSLGILDELGQLQDQGLSSRQALEFSQQIKKLTMPHEMGELFKVIAFGKNYAHHLQGFSMQNHAGRL